jgi:hypothetical protein
MSLAKRAHRFRREIADAFVVDSGLPRKNRRKQFHRPASVLLSKDLPPRFCMIEVLAAQLQVSSSLATD